MDGARVMHELYSHAMTCLMAYHKKKRTEAIVLQAIRATLSTYNMDRRSPIPKLLTHSSNSVTKLTDRKIRWIIREKMKEIISTNDIALLHALSTNVDMKDIAYSNVALVREQIKAVPCRV